MRRWRCPAVPVFDDLDRPTGFAVGPDGALCVGYRGVMAMLGEVFRIVP